MNLAKYVIVSINEDGEREIIFVTNDETELAKRWLAFAGSGAIYVLSPTPLAS